MTLDNLIPKNTLIIIALERELPRKLLPNWNVVYCGVGKVNAAFSVVKAYNTFKPTVIINYGTAGSLNENLNGLIPINSFKQRDMDVRPLGFELGETPYDKINCITFDYEGYSCGTGDNFVIGKQKLETDIVDMESYPIAKFCLLNNITFFCYKYISDNANKDAANDWELNIQKGANLFVKYLDNFI